MSTVWFVLQKPISSLWRGVEAASWKRLCAKIFGFDETEINLDRDPELMSDPTTYDRPGKRYDRIIYGYLDVTKRLTPEPILSHQLAWIALSCMRYLDRQDPNNPPMRDNLLASWATKSKRLPWLWSHRMRGTSIGRRQPMREYDVPKYSFPQSLRRSHQVLYSEGIQSEKFYHERHIFYIWTLDLLLHTLRAAMKSDELIKALSKAFIPSVACILFPLRIKRIQEAVGAYFEKVSRRTYSHLRTPADMYISLC